MKNPILKFGVYGGLILVGVNTISWLFLHEHLSYRNSEILGYAAILLATSMIFFGVRSYRGQVAEGAMTFGKAFRVGTLINLVLSGFMFVYAFLFFALMGDKFQEWAQGAMPAEQWAEMEAQMAQLPAWVMTPLFQGALMFVTVFLIGLIVTLISALVLRNR